MNTYIQIGVGVIAGSAVGLGVGVAIAKRNSNKAIDILKKSYEKKIECLTSKLDVEHAKREQFANEIESKIESDFKTVEHYEDEDDEEDDSEGYDPFRELEFDEYELLRQRGVITRFYDYYIRSKVLISMHDNSEVILEDILGESPEAIKRIKSCEHTETLYFYDHKNDSVAVFDIIYDNPDYEEDIGDTYDVPLDIIIDDEDDEEDDFDDLF